MNYYNILNELINDKYAGIAKIYDIKINHDIIKIHLNHKGKLDKKEYLQFIKDIFKIKTYHIMLDDFNKFDIYFRRERDSLFYLNKIMVFK